MTRGEATIGMGVPPSRWFLIGLALVLLVVAFVLVAPFLGAIVLSLLIGYLMQPVHRRILGVVRFPSLAAALGLVLVTLALVLPVVFIVNQLADEAQTVLSFVQSAEFTSWLDATAARFGVSPEQTDQLLARAAVAVAEGLETALVPTLTVAVNVIAGTILFFFLLFFVLRDGGAFGAGIQRLTPLRPQAKAHLFGLIGARTRAIALGTFLVSIAQGLVAGIGWWIFGFPAPIFWGFVMAVIAVLPLGAPAFVMVPAGAVALLQGDYVAGVGILVWAGGVGLVDNFLRPIVVSRGSDVHPAVILVGTIGGLAVFGVSGFLLGPLFLSMLGPVLEVWAEERREQSIVL